MMRKFEGQVENFDGLELSGWVSFDAADVPDIVVEIAGLRRRKIENLHRRPDLVAAKTEASGGFRITLDDLYPDLLACSTSGNGSPYKVTVCARYQSGAEIVFFEFIGSWGLLEAASATRSRSNGRVETFTGRWISGWALSDKSEPVRVEVVEDGNIIATVFTGLYRAHVGRIHRNGQYGGFIMATPQRLCDGFPHSVSVRLASGWVFPGFPREVRLGKFVGYVEKIEANSIEGWFGSLRDSDQSPKVLTILCNNEPIGVTNFRESRPDITASGLAVSAYAFQFATKRGIFAEDVVSVVDKTSGYQLRVAADAKAAGLPSAIVGHLDHMDEGRIVGWAVDRRSPAKVLRVVAFIDGLPAAEAHTDGVRSDIQLSFQQTVRPEFTIRMPDALQDGMPHELELRVSGSACVLGGTPATIQLPRRPPVFRRSDTPTLNTLDHRIAAAIELINRSPVAKAEGGVSHIILNRNGGEVFVRCLESLLKHLDFTQDELLIVDHGSNDISRDALVRLETVQLAKVIWKNRNDSFSKSNNDAAAVAAKRILLLLNNDIELVSNISRAIEQHLGSPDIGAVGIKLYDLAEPSTEGSMAQGLRELRIQHLGVWFRPGDAATGYNLGGYDITAAAAAREVFGVHDVAVVTGAALGIRAEDFRALGGFDETYVYGTEDIDLCLRIRQTGKRVICDRSLEALHVRGYTRLTRRGEGVPDHFTSNKKHLWTKFGVSLRRHHLQSLVARDGVYAPPQFRIGFAVTEAVAHSLAGDYFTALEMARALADHTGVEYVFLSETEDWYDCFDLDAVIVMRQDYDLRRVRNQKAHCLFLGWARNQFRVWLKQPWMERFDAVLSSSKLFSDLLFRQFGTRAHTLYIATSFQHHGRAGAPIEHDVLFIGSRWGATRDVERSLFPDRINGSVQVYGMGFGDAPNLRPVWGDVLPYAEVEAKYHRSRIVVDDANHTTKRWGSPNSRVFDAMAAGAVVLTNSAATSAVLGKTIPVWNNAEDLTRQINSLLADKDELARCAAEQAGVVVGQHTYTARAARLLAILQDHAAVSLRIDILTAVPREADAELWGDWHFGQSLARAFRKKGHAVRVRKLNEKVDRATDVVLGLRGLQRFEPIVGAANLLWIISHPDLIAADELKGWQHVFVASKTLAERFAPYCKSISVLEQATDCAPSSLWAARADQLPRPRGGVFVGNTRGTTRAFIEMAAAANLDFRIWGQGWIGGPLEDRVVAASIENKSLGALYAGAAFVLSDHWPDMAGQGIVSNRVFDALAAGGVVITDPVVGMESLGLPNLLVCTNAREIMDAAQRAARITDEERLQGGRLVAAAFSFNDRAGRVLEHATACYEPHRAPCLQHSPLSLHKHE